MGSFTRGWPSPQRKGTHDRTSAKDARRSPRTQLRPADPEDVRRQGRQVCPPLRQIAGPAGARGCAPLPGALGRQGRLVVLVQPGGLRAALLLPHDAGQGLGGQAHPVRQEAAQAAGSSQPPGGHAAVREDHQHEASRDTDARVLSGALVFQGRLAHLADPDSFADHLRRTYASNWVIYSKPPFGGVGQHACDLDPAPARTASTCSIAIFVFVR